MQPITRFTQPVRKVFPLTRGKLIGGFILILIAGWFTWTKVRGAKTETPAYQTGVAEQGTLVVSLSAAGTVTSANSRSVATNVSGVVKKVYVQNGQTVKSGQAIMEIDLDQESSQAYTQALAAYQTAKNSVASAKATQYSQQAAMFGKWDTYKELAESEEYKDPNSANRSLPEYLIPQNEWLAAEAQYQNQQAVVSAAQTSLSNAAQNLRLVSPVIYAPIPGTVSGLALQTGAVIEPASSGTSGTASSLTVAKIMTTAAPTVTVNLTEVDIPKVKTGQKATITIDALGDKTFTGKVISIDPSGSVSSGVTSYPAVIAFDTATPDVYANMSAQVNLITQTKADVLMVPNGAVQTQNGQSTVRVLKDGQVQFILVETGISSDTSTEIVSGLSEGDEVVTGTTAASTSTRGTQTTSPFGSFGGPATFRGGGGGGVNMIRIAR